MESALIVSATDQGTAFFTELLHGASIDNISVLASCAEARRLLSARDFDLVLINAPLRDESGIDLARQIGIKGVSQVILFVKSEHFDAVSALCEQDGVLTISKPVNRAVFWSALKFAGAAQSRMQRMQVENSRLKQKIEDIRIIDRAKYILISQLGMDEQQAHRHIEKQAMDRRSTRRVIAEEILKADED